MQWYAHDDVSTIVMLHGPPSFIMQLHAVSMSNCIPMHAGLNGTRGSWPSSSGMHYTTI